MPHANDLPEEPLARMLIHIGMSLITSPTFGTREEAEQAAQLLLQRGIPASSISLRDEHTAGAQIEGLSLGMGVPAEATEAVIAEHDGSAADGFVLQVDDRGDMLNEMACKEVFGYLA